MSKNNMLGHPCFEAKAAKEMGRIHLPVAKSCNIKCNYCDKKISCLNEKHPGACFKVIPPDEALYLYKKAKSQDDRLKIVGVSGPGDPLFNDETFKTFELIKKYDRDAIFCISTNGTLLSQKLDMLLFYDVSYLTITINAVSAEVAKDIYEYAFYDEKFYFDIEAARLIVNLQQEGLLKAAQKGLNVKVNTVLIPTINDSHIEEVAKRVKYLGANVMNIMPLIPYAKFSHLEKPSCDLIFNIRKRCQDIIEQISHCNQCRSDAIGLLV